MTLEQIKAAVNTGQAIKINIRSKSWETDRWTKFKNGATITRYAKWIIEDRGFENEEIAEEELCYWSGHLCYTNHMLMIEDTANGKWYQGNHRECRFFMSALESEIEKLLSHSE